MPTNQAAWLDGPSSRLRVGESEMPVPGEGEIVIKNHAVAAEHIDYKVQASGFFLKSFPNILGLDVAGEVVEVGPGVTRFKKGDRVVAQAQGVLTSNPHHGGYQLFTAAATNTTAHLPANISYANAVTLPVGLSTAIAGLSSGSGKGLGLPLPTSPTAAPALIGKTLVVWGGSSCVGIFVIQLAVAAGVRVIAVAGAKNLGLCRDLGAAQVFDHRSKDVVKQVVDAVKAAGGEYVGLYNAVSTAESYVGVWPVVEGLGGGVVINTTSSTGTKVPDHLKNVEVINVFGAGPVTWPIWENWVTPAFESGKLKCALETWVVGKGLESVQLALDELKKGVSAKKVVVELV